MTKHKVTLLPSEETVYIEEEKNLLEALRAQDIYIKSSCGGVASCSDCIIKIQSGEDNITPPPFEELALLGNVFHITKERLSCQTCVTGDVTIDISQHDKAKDQQRLKQKSSKSRGGVRVRKKGEVKRLKEEREKERQEFESEKREKSQEWHEHWKKEKDPMKPKNRGGNRRPKKKK